MDPSTGLLFTFGDTVFTPKSIQQCGITGFWDCHRWYVDTHTYRHNEQRNILCKTNTLK